MQGLKRGSVRIQDSFDAQWKLDESTGCWHWQRAKICGYGVFVINGKRTSAHRFAYERKCGPIQDGLFVLHKCDNPSCCNPDHLFLGTQADNMSDCRLKGRNNIGERNGGAKLTRQDVDEIRRLRAETGATYYVLADRFGVAYQTIHKIVKGQKWAAWA